MASEGRSGLVAGLVCLLLGVMSALAPCACLAVEAQVRGAFNTTDLYNTGLGATVLDGRLDTEIEFGRFLFGGAWRGYHLSDETYNPRGIEYPQPKIKHRYAEVSMEGPGGRGSLGLRAGDFFATFDRGLTLRSFEEVDLERDTFLDGILLDSELPVDLWRGVGGSREGESAESGSSGSSQAAGRVRVTALSGKVNEPISDIRWNEHKASGGRVSFTREGSFSVGASALARRVERRDLEVALPPALRVFDDRVFGAEAEAWLGVLHAAGDYAYRNGDYYPALSQGEIAGHGGYGTLTMALPGIILVGEYKDYRFFDDFLVNPPTCVLEHRATLMNRVTHEVDLNDERGFLVEGELSLIEGLPLTGGASEARRENGDLAHWEIFGYGEHAADGLGTIGLDGSWSREYVSGKFTEFMTAVLETELGVAEGTLPFEFGLGGQRVEEPSGTAFENYQAQVTWYVDPVVTISAVGETTTEEGLDREYWLFGEMGLAIRQGLDAWAGFGTERGGKKCSGGVCFNEPEFTGARIRLLMSF